MNNMVGCEMAVHMQHSLHAVSPHQSENSIIWLCPNMSSKGTVNVTSYSARTGVLQGPVINEMMESAEMVMKTGGNESLKTGHVAVCTVQRKYFCV